MNEFWQHIQVGYMNDFIKLEAKLKTFDDVLACDNFLILPNNMLFVITTVPNNAFALLIKTISKAKNVFGRVLYYFSLPLINWLKLENISEIKLY